MVTEIHAKYYTMKIVLAELYGRISRKGTLRKNFILYHYQFGSKWDTEFWRYAKSISDFINDDPEWVSYKEYSIHAKLHWTTERIFERNVYGLHTPFSIRNCYEGIESSL